MYLFTFIGGILLFFLGIKLFNKNMYEYTESSFIKLIKKISKNKYLFLLLGIIITIILQSSSLCICLVIALIHNKILDLDNSIYFIMGSNIGTCATAYLFTLPSIYFVIIFSILGIIFLLFKNKYYKLFLAMTIIFLSMYLMKNSASFLENSFILDILLKYNNKYFNIFISFLITGIIQSSSVFTTILQSLLYNNLIDLNTCFYMILGSNIGTAITAIIVSIGMEKDAKRCSYINIIFNVLGTIMLLIIMNIFDIEKLLLNISNNTVLVLANYNLLLNIINVVGVFYFSKYILKIIKKLIT